MRSRGMETPVRPRKRYVIIGNSAAGLAAAQAIRLHDRPGKITILSDEPHFGYSRVLLPLFIGRKIRRRDLFIASKDFYSSLAVQLLRNSPALAVDPQAQTVRIASGRSIPFDSLLVATGASPRTLGAPGENLPGIHYLRKLADAQAIQEDLSSSAGPVILAGGGLVGVKSLEALLSRRRKVHLVVSSDRILSQMLDGPASDLFLDVFRKKGVEVRLHTEIREFEGRERLENAILSTGENLPVSMAIIGKGVRPNLNILRGTGAILDQGVLVNEGMATHAANIFAAGDVAEPLDVLQGKPRANAIWPSAVEGGRVAGCNMASGPAYFSGAIRMNSVEVFGTRVISVGELEGEAITRFRREERLYRKLVFSGDRLTGFLLAGDIRGAGVLTAMVKSGTEISPSDLEEGLERGFSYAPRLKSLAGSIRATQAGSP